MVSQSINRKAPSQLMVRYILADGVLRLGGGCSSSHRRSSSSHHLLWLTYIFLSISLLMALEGFVVVCDIVDLLWCWCLLAALIHTRKISTLSFIKGNGFIFLW